MVRCSKQDVEKNGFCVPNSGARFKPPWWRCKTATSSYLIQNPSHNLKSQPASGAVVVLSQQHSEMRGSASSIIIVSTSSAPLFSVYDHFCRCLMIVVWNCHRRPCWSVHQSGHCGLCCHENGLASQSRPLGANPWWQSFSLHSLPLNVATGYHPPQAPAVAASSEVGFGADVQHVWILRVAVAVVSSPARAGTNCRR